MCSEDSQRNAKATASSGVDALEEWPDVEYELHPLDDAACVDYSLRFRQVFGLLLVAMKLPERSARGLRLAKAAININKAHVSAWKYRLECASALGNVWRSELASVGSLLLRSPKNYQAWEYRRRVAEASDAYDREAGFVDVALDHDAKNYHAWSHRQWLLRLGKLNRKDELRATDDLLIRDVRNNSAWNHRWLLISGADAGTMGNEVKYALDKVEGAPKNEALWNYVAALHRVGVDVTEAREVAEDCVAKDGNCIAARWFLLRTATDIDLDKAAAECDDLAKVDAIRKKYWRFRAEQYRSRKAKQK